MFNARLWRQGRFVRFFVGASISIIGNWFNTVAIALLTYRISGQVALVATTIAVSVLPRALLGPLGGALADRFERRRILIALDSARAVVALLPLLAHDAATLWLVYVAVVLLQAGMCVYSPAQGAYLPQLVSDDVLEPANAAFAVMRDIGLFVGPALAAAVLGLWGTSMAFWCNALSFAVSAMVLFTLPQTMDRGTSGVGPVALITGYVAIVRRYPSTAALYLCYLASVPPVYFFVGIMVAYVKTLGQPTTFLGLLYGAAGIGGAVGGLAMGQYLRRLPYATAIAMYLLSVPLLAVLSLVHQAVLALLLLAGSTAAGTAGDVIFGVGVQRHVAAAERGRAFGLLFWCVAVGQLIGAGLGIALAGDAVPAILWISGAFFPVVLAGAWLSIRAHRSIDGALASPLVEATG